MKLKDYVLRWQEVYDKNQSRPTTYAAHGYIFKNHILPGLGDIPLSALTVEQVGDFLEERKRFGGHRPESPEYPGLGEHTMRHIHRLLQQCLDQAMRDGLIAENPARAFHYLSDAAQEGNQYAQYTLGKLYLTGQDVAQDQEQAYRWFWASASQGNEYAQFFLDHFNDNHSPNVLLSATKLLHHMGRIFQDNSIPPCPPGSQRADRNLRQ